MMFGMNLSRAMIDYLSRTERSELFSCCLEINIPSYVLTTFVFEDVVKNYTTLHYGGPKKPGGIITTDSLMV